MPSIEQRLSSVERRLDEVASRDAIRELTAEYCRQVVRGDTEGMLELFTGDASIGTHFPGGSGQDDVRPRGTAELREAYSDLGALQLRPCIHNHIIEVDGDRARGFCSVEIRFTQGGEPCTGAGHYEDEYRRVDGAWRFQHRELFIYHWVAHTKGWS